MIVQADNFGREHRMQFRNENPAFPNGDGPNLANRHRI